MMRRRMSSSFHAGPGRMVGSREEGLPGHGNITDMAGARGIEIAGRKAGTECPPIMARVHGLGFGISRPLAV